MQVAALPKDALVEIEAYLQQHTAIDFPQGYCPEWRKKEVQQTPVPSSL